MADFNPDEYLAKKPESFNPDAYLNSDKKASHPVYEPKSFQDLQDMAKIGKLGPEAIEKMGLADVYARYQAEIERQHQAIREQGTGLDAILVPKGLSAGAGVLASSPAVKTALSTIAGGALGAVAAPSGHKGLGALLGAAGGYNGRILPGKLGKIAEFFKNEKPAAESVVKPVVETTLPSGARELPSPEPAQILREPVPEGGQLRPRGVTPKWSPEERAYVEQQALEEASRPTSVELEQASTQAPRYKSAPRLSSEEAASMLEPEPTIQLEQSPVGPARGRVGMAPTGQQLSDILQAAGAPKTPATQSPAGVGMRYLSSQGDAMKGLSAEELSAILEKELGGYNQTLRRGKP